MSSQALCLNLQFFEMGILLINLSPRVERIEVNNVKKVLGGHLGDSLS